LLHATRSCPLAEETNRELETEPGLERELELELELELETELEINRELDIRIRPGRHARRLGNSRV